MNWEPSITGNQMWTMKVFIMGRVRFGEERQRRRGIKARVSRRDAATRKTEIRLCGHVHTKAAQARACAAAWARALNKEES